jgi:3alpha(or 20beta)-hydroxysteroid dehydrogenase
MTAGPAVAAFAAVAQPNATPSVESLVRDLAIPRMGEPEEITRLVLFVASDEASFSTGSEFIAAGGYLLGPALQPEVEEAAAA